MEFIMELKLESYFFRVYMSCHVILFVLFSLQSVSNAIHTMVRVAGEPCLKLMMEFVINSLKDPSLTTVTLMEYEIMNHPEGDLYDKSVIER